MQIPILIYYLCLFALVIIFNLVKVFNQEPNTYLFKEKQYKNHFLFALEIVLASSGVIISLSEKIINIFVVVAVCFVYTVMIVYISLVNNTFPKKLVSTIYYSNIVIIVVTILIVIFVYVKVIPDIEKSPDVKKDTTLIQKDKIITYNVAIPYKDNTLIKHVGKDRLKSRYFIYIINIECENEMKAIDSAKSKFLSDVNSKPLFPDITGVDNKIEIDNYNIICEKMIKNH